MSSWVGSWIGFFFFWGGGVRWVDSSVNSWVSQQVMDEIMGCLG